MGDLFDNGLEKQDLPKIEEKGVVETPFSSEVKTDVTLNMNIKPYTNVLIKLDDVSDEAIKEIDKRIELAKLIVDKHEQKKEGEVNKNGVTQSAPVSNTPVNGPALVVGGQPVLCSKCGSTDLYDNRVNKRNPKGPDFKCKQPDCGAGWIRKGPHGEFISWAK